MCSETLPCLELVLLRSFSAQAVEAQGPSSGRQHGKGSSTDPPAPIGPLLGRGLQRSDEDDDGSDMPDTDMCRPEALKPWT